MDNNNNQKNEYRDLFQRFLNSDDDESFTKDEVKKIMEAYIYREIIAQKQKKVQKPKRRNLLVTSKAIGRKMFNRHFIISFFLSCLFYIGFLLLINEFIFPNLFVNKPTVFIIGLLFTIIDKLVKPFVFVFDLLTFTFHKVGLISLMIYTGVLFFASYFLNETISFERALLISVIVLVLIAFIDFLKRDSMIKTKYLEDELMRRDDDE